MAKSKKQLQQEEEEKKRREQQARISSMITDIRKKAASGSIGDESAPWRQDLTDDYRLRAVRNYNNQANYLGLPTYKNQTLSRRASQAQANTASYQAAGGKSYEKWLDDHFIGPKVDKNAKSTNILDLMNSYQSNRRETQAQAKQEQPYVAMMKGAAAKASGQMAGETTRRGITDVMTGRTAVGSTAGRNAQTPGTVRTGAAGGSGFVPDMEYLNRRTGNGPTPISSRKLPEPMVTGSGIGGAAGQNNGQINTRYSVRPAEGMNAGSGKAAVLMPQVIGANGQKIGTGTKVQAQEFTAPKVGRITASAGARQTAANPAAGVSLPEQFGGMSAAMPEDKSRYGLGNIDLLNRPVYTQPDGSISTVNSMSYWDDRENKEILIPTIVNGKQVSDDEAIRHYEETGEHLGKFNSPQEADQYAEWLHEQQEDYYSGQEDDYTGQEQKKQDIMLGKHAMLTGKNLGVKPYTDRTLEDSMRRDMNRATQAARQNDIERRMNLYNEYSDVFTLDDVRELATSADLDEVEKRLSDRRAYGAAVTPQKGQRGQYSVADPNELKNARDIENRYIESGMFDTGKDYTLYSTNKLKNEIRRFEEEEEKAKQQAAKDPAEQERKQILKGAFTNLQVKYGTGFDWEEPAEGYDSIGEQMYDMVHGKGSYAAIAGKASKGTKDAEDLLPYALQAARENNSMFRTGNSALDEIPHDGTEQEIEAYRRVISGMLDVPQEQLYGARDRVSGIYDQVRGNVNNMDAVIDAVQRDQYAQWDAADEEILRMQEAYEQGGGDAEQAYYNYTGEDYAETERAFFGNKTVSQRQKEKLVRELARRENIKRMEEGAGEADPEGLSFTGLMAYMTDDERRKYAAMDESQRKAYLTALDPSLKAKDKIYGDSVSRSFASDPLWGGAASLASIGTNMAAGLIAPVRLAAYALGDESAGDPDSAWSGVQHLTDVYRNTRGEVWGQNLNNAINVPETLAAMAVVQAMPQDQRMQYLQGVLDKQNARAQGADSFGNFLYQTTMSIADNLAAMGVAYGAAGGNMNTTLAKGIIQMIMSSEATSSAFQRALEKGVDPTEAALVSVGNGLVEAATEYWSLDRRFGGLTGTSRQAIVNYLISNAAIEGFEEVNADFLNAGLDWIASRANGHETELESRGNELFAQYKRDPALQGMSDKELRKKADHDATLEWWGQVGSSFAAGSLSGFVLSKVYSGTVNRYVDAYTQTGENVAKLDTADVEKILTSSRELVDESKGGQMKTRSEKNLMRALNKASEELKTDGKISAQIASDVLFNIDQVTAQRGGQGGRIAAEAWKTSIDNMARSGITARLEQLGEKVEGAKVTKAAEAIGTMMTNNGRISPAQQRAIDVVPGAQDVADQLMANKLSGNERQAEAIKQATGEAIRADARTQQEKAAVNTKTTVNDLLNKQFRQEVANKAISDPQIASEDDFRAAKGERTNSHVEAVAGDVIGDIMRAENGKLIVRAQDGTETKVNPWDVKAAEGVMGQAAKWMSMERGALSDTLMNDIITMVRDGTMNEKNSGQVLLDSYMVHVAGYAKAAMPKTDLDPKIARAVYDTAREEAVRDAEELAKKPLKPLRPNEGEVTINLDGEAVNREDKKAWKAELKKIGDLAQRQRVSFYADLMHRMGLDLEIVDDKSRPDIYGSYLNGRIMLNIAGTEGKAENQRKHHIGVALSHEVTHFLKKYSGDSYEQLKNYVIDTLEKQGVSVNNLIAHKMDQYNADAAVNEDGTPAKLMSVEGALDEVVADACGEMLGQEEFVSGLKQNQTLYEKIRGYVQNFVRRFQAATRGMSQSLSAEAQLMHGNVKELARLWNVSLNESLEKAYQSKNENQTDLTGPETDSLPEQKEFAMNSIAERVAVEGNELVAIHNLKARDILADLKMNGFPSPSIAVVQAKNGWGQYGDISVIFDRYTVDPKLNPKARLYGGDAFTPTLGSFNTEGSAQRALEHLRSKPEREMGVALSKYTVPSFQKLYDIEQVRRMHADENHQDREGRGKLLLAANEIENELHKHWQDFVLADEISFYDMNEAGIRTLVQILDATNADEAADMIAMDDEDLAWNFNLMMQQNLRDLGRNAEYYQAEVFNADNVDKLRNYLKKAQLAYTDMSEAKPDEIVGFDHVKLVMVPEDVSKDVTDALEDAGINYKTYERGGLFGEKRTAALNEWLNEYSREVHAPEEAVLFSRARKDVNTDDWKSYKMVDGKMMMNDQRGNATELTGLDREYVEAWKRDDYERMEEILADKIRQNGAIPFKAPNAYNNPDHKWIAQNIKKGDTYAIQRAAAEMAEMVPKNAVLVPMPNHHGIVDENTDTRILADEIAKITGSPVINALAGIERESRYTDKQKPKSQQMKAADLGFRQVMEIPEGKVPYIVDNVVASGLTAQAAHEALGNNGVTLAYAKSTLSANDGLKRANVTFYDTNKQYGQYLIPLSERIDMSKTGYAGVKFSRADMDADVNTFMMGLEPEDLNSNAERKLLQDYKARAEAVKATEDRIRGMNEELKQATGDEARKLTINLQTEWAKLDRQRQELYDITDSEGYAGMMYRYQRMMREYMSGRTADQVRMSAREAGQAAEAAQKNAAKLAEELKGLAAQQDVQAVTSIFRKNDLKARADALIKATQSSLTSEEVQADLARIALKRAMKQNARADLEALAGKLNLNQVGIRNSEAMGALEEMRGMEIGLDDQQWGDLKSAGWDAAKIRRTLAGTGITMRHGGRYLDIQGAQLGEIEKAAPGRIDVTSTDWPSQLLKLAEDAKQTHQEYDEAQRMSEDAILSTIEVISDTLAGITPTIPKDPAVAEQIRQLMTYNQRLSRSAQEAAGGMEGVNRMLEDIRRRNAAAAGAESVMSRDVTRAIEYYSKMSDLAHERSNAAEMEQLRRTLESQGAQRVMEEQARWRNVLETSERVRNMAEKNEKARRQVNTVVGRINDRIINETDIRNVPESVKGIARAMVGMFVRNDTGGGRRFGTADTKTLNEWRKIYDAMDQRDGTDLSFDWVSEEDRGDVQDAVEKALQDIRDGLGFWQSSKGRSEANVQGMKNALGRIQRGVNQIYEIIRSQTEVEINGRKQDVAELAYEAETEAEKREPFREYEGKLGRTAGAASRFAFWGNMTPQYFFKRLGNNALSLLHGNMKNGEHRTGLLQHEYKEKFADLAEKQGFSSYDTDEKRTFTLKNGDTVTLTTGQMMSLYALWNREQTLGPEWSNHILGGGIVPGEIREDKLWVRKRAEERPHRVDAADVMTIIHALTNEQRALVDDVVHVLSTDGSRLGNEASMKMYGIKKYNETYYFPFNTWDGVKNKNSNAGGALTSPTAQNALKQSSFSKRRIRNASSPLVLDDFMYTAVKHMNQMITYSTMVNAVENFNKVLNFRLNTSAVEGQTRLDNPVSRNVEALLRERYGKNAVDYLRTWMQDINKGIKPDTRKSLQEYLLGLFRKNAVAGSLSVALQQPLSYIRAANGIDTKYLLAAMNPATFKGSYKEMMAHSGVAVIKDMGRFDVNYGVTGTEYMMPDGYRKVGTKIREGIEEYSTILPELMDQVTWTRMWTACKLEQQALNPDADVRSDAFLDKVAERFNELMRDTQVYDSLMVRSANMRSPSFPMKTLTSFMAEPTLTANLITDSFRTVKAKGGKKKLAEALATYLISAVAQAAIKAGMGAGRTPDEKKTFAENFSYKFAYNAISELNPFTMIPGYDELVTALSGSDINDDAYSVVKKLRDAAVQLPGMFDKSGGELYRGVEDSAGQIAQLFTGVPVKNIMRDLRAMYNYFKGGTYADRETSGAVIKYQTIDTVAKQNLIGMINKYLKDAGAGGYDTTNEAYYGRIYQAMREGRTQDAEEMAEYLELGKGVKPETVESKIGTAARKDADASAAETADFLISSGMMGDADYINDSYVSGEMTSAEYGEAWRRMYPGKSEDDLYWQIDKLDYRREHGGDDGYSKYLGLREAIGNNRADEIRAAVNTMTAHGTTMENIRTQITKDYKDAYLDAKGDEKRRLRDALVKAYKAAGMSEDDANKKINSWKK